MPASAKWRARSSGWLSVTSGNWLSSALGDPAVQRAAGLAQQRAVGGVLDQRMLEQISRMRRRTRGEKQARLDETVERTGKLRFGLAGHRSQQGVRKLPADRGA